METRPHDSRQISLSCGLSCSLLFLILLLLVQDQYCLQRHFTTTSIRFKQQSQQIEAVQNSCRTLDQLRGSLPRDWRSSDRRQTQIHNSLIPPIAHLLWLLYIQLEQRAKCLQYLFDTKGQELTRTCTCRYAYMCNDAETLANSIQYIVHTKQKQRMSRAKGVNR